MTALKCMNKLEDKTIKNREMRLIFKKYSFKVIKKTPETQNI